MIAPKKNASSRTKNRIIEHGRDMNELGTVQCVACFNGEAGTLFRAKDGWFGWLPTNEVDIIG